MWADTLQRALVARALQSSAVLAFSPRSTKPCPTWSITWYEQETVRASRLQEAGAPPHYTSPK